MQRSTKENNRRYTFKAISAYPLLQLFKQSAEMVLTQLFIKDNRAHLQTLMFELEVTTQLRKWRIIKKYQDFLQLTQSLNIRYRDYLLKLPDQKEEVREELQQHWLSFFEIFLNRLSEAADIDEEQEWRRFLYGQLPSQNRQMYVYFQGYLSKRNWGRHNESGFKKMFNFLASWERRFFTITKDGLYFTPDEKSHEIQDNLIFSTTFGFTCGEAATGYPYGVLVNSSHRALQLDAGDVFTLGLFVHYLGKAVQESKNIRQNRFGSFARVRTGCEAEYFIDGQDYFQNLCDHLLAAKKEVFITGWMISPFFSLKRPDDKEEFRLDVVLGRLARSGIKINIVIYNAPKMALAIDSQFSQKYLTGLSPNIRVLMHPNYIMIPFIWSHHEKMVIVDQTTAFLGGLDLGYGRFDSKMHYLTDPAGEFWPGVDYCNYRVTDIYNPKDFRVCSIDRKTVPRMPWHDIAVRLTGDSVQDLSRHFIQYWNHVNFQLSMGDRELLMYVGLSSIEIDTHKVIPEMEEKRLQARRMKQNRMALGSASTPKEDFAAQFDFLNLEEEENKPARSHRSAVYTLSSEDTQAQSYTSSIYESGSKQHEEEMEFYAANLQDVSKLQQFFSKLNPKNILNHRFGVSFQDVTLKQGSQSTRSSRQHLQTHQIVRSESMWSIGLQQTETQCSILNAYYDLINNAREFIYIENQFFISKENRIAKCIVNKILEAAKQRKKFRVIILLPALPGFQGHPADERAAVFRVQVHLHLQNINYVYHKLRKVPNLDNYLFFFSLRTHAKLADRPVTEIIYIHSKLLIVDDRIALIGSANINDRSMLGDRDSQLAVVIEDDRLQQVRVGQGETRKVGRFAHALRKELYMQHFALTDSQAADYFNDDIWDAMVEISRKNHHIYRELFGCYPDDEMTSFQKMAEVQSEADPKRYNLLAGLIRGQAIPFQRRFLAEENLELRPSQKEYFVPMTSFT